jgi:hypothetical protein
MSEFRKPLDTELAAIEAAFGGLLPRPSAVERDRLMFLAGRASVAVSSGHRIRGWLWPAATAASLGAAVMFAALWATVSRSAPGRVTGDANQRIASSTENGDASDDHLAASSYVPTPPTAAPSPWRLTNRQLCQLIAEKGIDALPAPAWLPGGGPTPPRHDSYRELLRQFTEEAS